MSTWPVQTFAVRLLFTAPVYTDSKYLLRAVAVWLNSWERFVLVDVSMNMYYLAWHIHLYCHLEFMSELALIGFRCLREPLTSENWLLPPSIRTEFVYCTVLLWLWLQNLNDTFSAWYKWQPLRLRNKARTKDQNLWVIPLLSLTGSVLKILSNL